MENIYLIPGLGADERVFQYLTLPWKSVNIIHWIEPLPDESLRDYCIRLSEQIKTDPPPILMGVSFGGMVAVELNQIVKAEKVILISSAKNANALPGILQAIGKTGIIKWIPNALFKSSNWLVYYLFDAHSKQDKQLLKEIIKDTNPHFVKWALTAISGWNYTGISQNVISIHGKKDKLIPLKSADYTIDSGGHFMIVNKSEAVSRVIFEINDLN
jgi:pimeloyl-ACP methyl ester carboxylesterase